MTEAAEPEGGFLAGLTVALLLVAIVVAERLDVARLTVASVREASGKGVAADARPPGWIWFLVLVVGAVMALLVIERLAGGVREDRRVWFCRFAYGAIAAWAVWLLLGLASTLGLRSPGWVHVGPHLISVGLALAALWRARNTLGDAETAWKRASVVRMPLALVVALVALVFLVPLTAAQVADVLRAWGDGPYTRAVNGVTAALLLGAVIRSSTIRTLAPANPKAERPKWRQGYTIALVAGAVVALGLLAWAQAFLGCAVILIGAAIVRRTDWAKPALAAVDEEAGERRLAATLSVVPLGIVVAGLAGAALDSLVLPTEATWADVRLVGVTVAATVLFALLVGGVQEGEHARWRPRTHEAFVLGLVVGFVACVLPRELDGTFNSGSLDSLFAVLWTLPLLGVAALLALRVIGGPRGAALWVGFGAVFAVVVSVYLDPVGVPRGLGTFAVALLGTAALVLTAHALGVGGYRRKPKWNRSWIPKRVPVMTLLGVWIVVAALWPLDDVDTFHQARTVDSASATGTVDAAVRTWVRRQGTIEDRYLPMVIVGASGGGAKAAYWTDLVVDCMLGDGSPSDTDANECAGSGSDDDRYDRFFLTSSVSGGSVGVYHLLNHQSDIDDGADWVERAAGREVLSPITAWGLFHDAPTFMVRMPTNPSKCDNKSRCRRHADRALVQEAAVADFHHDIVPPAGGRHLIEAADGPVPVFNGAVNGAQGRVLLSRLALAPPRVDDPRCEQRQPPGKHDPAAGSLDGHDVLRSEGTKTGPDVPLVTAALLSARFPVVAPPGRLGDRELENPSCGTRPPLRPVTVRDGGYVENTGMLTVTELLPAIRRAVDRYKPSGVHVQIVVVSIDDDPIVLDDNPTLTERRAPALGIAQRVGDKYLSSLARDRLTSCQYRDVTYVRVSPPPHAGAQAATGWEISRTAREGDLGAALTLPHRAAKDVEFLRHILDGTSRPRGCAEPYPAPGTPPR